MSKPTLRVLFFGLIAFLLAICVSFTETKGALAATESRGECVIEITSRRFLHEKNGDMPMPMASTTKILTAIIIIDDCDLQETITVPKAAEGVEGSSVYLRAGDEYTVEDLLYGLMLRSGNDCAETLALHHSGSISAFANVMNEKAAFLGASDSFFVNPHGLPAEGHHTTARDLALIASYAMENPAFEKIVSTKYYQRHNWQNKNKMLWNFEGATGVKTGFTMNAGRCLVTSADRDGMKLLSVVLNSPEMYERTAELLDGAYAKYRMTELFNCNQTIEGLCAARSFSYPLTDEERGKISVRVEKISPLPEHSGDFAGTMQIMLENDLLFSQNLYII